MPSGEINLLFQLSSLLYKYLYMKKYINVFYIYNPEV